MSLCAHAHTIVGLSVCLSVSPYLGNDRNGVVAAVFERGMVKSGGAEGVCAILVYA